MLGKLLPLLMGLAGLGAGVGAGLALRPVPEAMPAQDTGNGEAEAAGHGTEPESVSHAAGDGALPDAGEHAGETADHADATAGEAAPEEGHADGGASRLPEYVKLNNQFIVPVVEEGRVRATVIMALSLEVSAGTTEEVYAREPRLRDAFLQVLFDHANAGGFRGTFTDGANLVFLRSALKEAARKVMGESVSDVLISDLARQDS